MQKQTMEHKPAPAKPMNKILKFLPRATSSVSFQSPPIYSPAKDKRSSDKTLKSLLGIGFSGPIVSMVPADNRRKTKNSPFTTAVQEPTSPKVSCMGTVKCKHMQRIQNQKKTKPAATLAAVDETTNKPLKNFNRTVSFPEPAAKSAIIKLKQEPVAAPAPPAAKIKKNTAAAIRSIFGGGRRKSDASAGGDNDRRSKNYPKPPLNLDKAPSLSQMKRFASGRDTFMNFDWTTQVAPVETDHRRYYSDEEGGGESDDEVNISIPFSAPLMMVNRNINNINGGINGNNNNISGVSLEPRKEINLWKRRTMAQPKPLQLHELV